MTFEYIFALMRRALPLVLLGMLGFGLVALVYSLLAPHTYVATARVIVEPQARTIAASDDTNAPVPQREANDIDTEVMLLESRAVADRVVRERRLQRDPEFGAATLDGTVDKFAKALEIRRVAMTYLIDIGVASRSPTRAAELANDTANAYIALQKERKRSVTQNANTLLGQRVQQMAGQVRIAEADVQRFRQANNLLSVNGTTLAEQSASTINDQLAVARAGEQAARGELAAALASPDTLDTANAQQSLGSLRQQQAQAMQDMSAAQASYGAQHPNYVTAQQRLTQINRAIEAEMGRARAAASAQRDQRLTDLRAKAAAATNQRASLERSSNVNAAGLNNNSRASTALAELERRAAAVRSTYEQYLNRYQQTLTQLGTERSDSNLISRAVPPTSYSKPNLKLNVALGLLAGLLTGISISTLSILLQSHFSTSSQVEETLDLEGLPSLPTSESAKLGLGRNAGAADIARAMLAQPTGVFAEMHKSLLAAIARPVDGKPNQVMALASALPKEGKTTSAVCLAAMAGHLGTRTVLVDCDQRRRAATRELLGEPTTGLRQVLVDGQSWRTATVGTEFPNLDMLPASAAEQGAVDIFGGDAFGRLVAELRGQYDLVLFDTAPVLPIADAQADRGARRFGAVPVPLACHVPAGGALGAGAARPRGRTDRGRVADHGRHRQAIALRLRRPHLLLFQVQGILRRGCLKPCGASCRLRCWPWYLAYSPLTRCIHPALLVRTTLAFLHRAGVSQCPIGFWRLRAPRVMVRVRPVAAAARSFTSPI